MLPWVSEEGRELYRHPLQPSAIPRAECTLFNIRMTPLKREDWLAELHLSHYAVPLLEWCKASELVETRMKQQENGASSMEEVWQSWRSFSEKLQIKPLERKRLVTWLAS